MAQAKLVKVEQKENGVKLTFLDFDGKEIIGIYNGNKLNSEKLEKMIGNRISFTEFKEEDKKGEIDLHKAWDEREVPTFCDDLRHAFDR